MLRSLLGSLDVPPVETTSTRTPNTNSSTSFYACARDHARRSKSAFDNGTFLRHCLAADESQPTNMATGPDTPITSALLAPPSHQSAALYLIRGKIKAAPRLTQPGRQRHIRLDFFRCAWPDTVLCRHGAPVAPSLWTTPPPWPACLR